MTRRRTKTKEKSEGRKQLRWNFADVARALKRGVMLILHGELIKKLQASLYFVHIFYTFFLFGIAIWFSIMVETTMSKVEHNRKVIDELEIVHSQKVFDVEALSRRSSVEARLKEMGSEVADPDNPAYTIR